jgi:hypothetical protein
VFENRLLRRICGHKRKEVPRSGREVLDELYNLYSLPSIVRTFEYRQMRWVENVVCMGEKRSGYKVLVENLKARRDRFQDLGIDGRIILK